MKRHATTAAALFLGCTITTVSSMASAIQWAGNGHSYEVFSAPGLDWESAQTAALAKGGYLATLTSAEEDSFVASILDPNMGEVWAGGYQPTLNPQTPAYFDGPTPFFQGPGDGWMWVNGEGAFDYTNWNGGEPNDTGGDEHFLGINWPGTQKWNDEAALGNIAGYVVEYNRTPDAGSTLSLLGLGMIGLAALRRRLS